MKILQEFGIDAIRTAHNPPSSEFLDLCDRMGLLVVEGFFDYFLKTTDPQDYHLYFK